MASTLQTELITNNKSLVVFDLLVDFPAQGSTNYIFYVDATDTSYQWNSGTSTYDILSSTATDLLFYDNLVSFPVTGNSISLYVAQDTDFIYQWNTTSLAYEYVKAITSEALMLIEGSYVKYSSPAANPQQISLNEVYRILSDNGRSYIIIDNGNKFYLDVNLAMQYFTLLSGQSWSDLLNNAVIPDPIDYSDITNINEQAILNNLKLLYDVDNDGLLDRAKFADYLNGKTGAYYYNKSEDLNIDRDKAIVFDNKFRIKLNDNADLLDIEVITN